MGFEREGMGSFLVKEPLSDGGALPKAIWSVSLNTQSSYMSGYPSALRARALSHRR